MSVTCDEPHAPHAEAVIKSLQSLNFLSGSCIWSSADQLQFLDGLRITHFDATDPTFKDRFKLLSESEKCPTFFVSRQDNTLRKEEAEKRRENSAEKVVVVTESDSDCVVAYMFYRISFTGLHAWQRNSLQVLIHRICCGRENAVDTTKIMISSVYREEEKQFKNFKNKQGPVSTEFTLIAALPEDFVEKSKLATLSYKHASQNYYGATKHVLANKFKKYEDSNLKLLNFTWLSKVGFVYHFIQKQEIPDSSDAAYVVAMRLTSLCDLKPVSGKKRKIGESIETMFDGANNGAKADNFGRKALRAINFEAKRRLGYVILRYLKERLQNLGVGEKTNKEILLALELKLARGLPALLGEIKALQKKTATYMPEDKARWNNDVNVIAWDAFQEILLKKATELQDLVERLRHHFQPDSRAAPIDDIVEQSRTLFTWPEKMTFDEMINTFE